jgi:hypothetical protein
MAKKSKKLVHVYKPRVRLTGKGVKLTAPRARIGGKSGLNVSKSGISYSVRTKAGTVNSKRGCSRALSMLLLGVGLAVMIIESYLYCS